MTGMTDVIVSLWLLPVTLFIIIPLATLCGWAVIKLSRSLMKTQAKANCVPNKGMRWSWSEKAEAINLYLNKIRFF